MIVGRLLRNTTARLRSRSTAAYLAPKSRISQARENNLHVGSV